MAERALTSSSKLGSKSRRPGGSGRRMLAFTISTTLRYMLGGIDFFTFTKSTSSRSSCRFCSLLVAEPASFSATADGLYSRSLNSCSTEHSVRSVLN